MWTFSSSPARPPAAHGGNQALGRAGNGTQMNMIAGFDHPDGFVRGNCFHSAHVLAPFLFTMANIGRIIKHPYLQPDGLLKPKPQVLKKT